MVGDMLRILFLGGLKKKRDFKGVGGVVFFSFCLGLGYVVSDQGLVMD